MGAKTVERMPLKWKKITSGAIGYCTITMGIGIGLLGPSLVELSRKFETTIPTVSKIFSVTTVAFIIGSLISGVLMNYIHKQFATVIFVTAIGIATILFPIVPSVTVFFGVGAVAGFGWAGYDTAIIVWLIEIWENNAASAIQAQCFAYALGTFVSPILVKSFLPAEHQQVHVELNVTNSSVDDSHVYHSDGLPNLPEQASQLYIPFAIGGGMGVLGGIFITLLYFIRKCERSNSDLPEKSPEEEFTMEGKEEGWTQYNILLITIGFVLFSAYVGMEYGNIQFLATFAQFIDLKLPQKQAALVHSGLTGAYTIGRGLGIFIVRRVLPEYMLLGNFILLITGNIILLAFANTSVEALWAGSIITGTGLSTIFASLYGYLERYMKISNMASGILILAIGVGACLYPIVIGAYIETNPFVLMYSNFFGSIVSAICFVSWYIITHIKSKELRNNVYQVTMDTKSPQNEFGLAAKGNIGLANPQVHILENNI